MNSGYFIQVNSIKRELPFKEINQLLKDILWYYDQNVGDPYNTYVPGESFILHYWEYLTLQNDSQTGDSSELNFLLEGTLVLINGMICEYIPVFTSDVQIFGTTAISTIEQYVEGFQGKTEEQNKLRDITLIGLKVAKETDFTENEENKHPLYQDYLSEMVWVDKYFIQGHFKERLN